MFTLACCGNTNNKQMRHQLTASKHQYMGVGCLPSTCHVLQFLRATQHVSCCLIPPQVFSCHVIDGKISIVRQFHLFFHFQNDVLARSLCVALNCMCVAAHVTVSCGVVVTIVGMGRSWEDSVDQTQTSFAKQRKKKRTENTKNKSLLDAIWNVSNMWVVNVALCLKWVSFQSRKQKLGNMDPLDIIFGSSGKTRTRCSVGHREILMMRSIH